MDMVDFLVSLAILLVIALGIVEYIIYKKAKRIAIYLILAERDFNANLNSGLSHGGRKSNIAERQEWNKMALPLDAPIPVDLVPSLRNLAKIEFNQDGYKSVTHDLVEANQRELAAKGAAMGRAAITAFLLRELYAGNVRAAQQKIISETRNSAEGKPPYIAPGIDVLVGFDKFDPEKLRFEKEAGVEKWLLKRAVKGWGFPKDLRWLNDDTKELHNPWVALGLLYQQNPPSWISAASRISKAQ